LWRGCGDKCLPKWTDVIRKSVSFWQNLLRNKIWWVSIYMQTVYLSSKSWFQPFPFFNLNPKYASDQIPNCVGILLF
jgi:hypothetical protein